MKISKVSPRRWVIVDSWYIKNSNSIERSCSVFVIVFLKIIKCALGLVFTWHVTNVTVYLRPFMVWMYNLLIQSTICSYYVNMIVLIETNIIQTKAHFSWLDIPTNKAELACLLSKINCIAGLYPSNTSSKVYRIY